VNQSALSRRKLLQFGIGLGGVVLLAACAPAASTSPTAAPAQPTAAAAGAATTPTTAAAGGATTPTAAPAAAGAPATNGAAITVSTRGAGDGDIMIKTAAAFTKSTGTKVTHVSYGPEPDYWAKVEATYATKQLADVVWASTGNLFNFANRGILRELDSVIKADNYDLTDYVPNALTSLTFKGKLVAMPWGAHPGNGGFLYNADMLNAAGFTKVTDNAESVLDWTYDMVLQAAQKVVKKTGDTIDVYGFNTGTDYLSLTNIIGSYGADFINADGTKLTMDAPEFLKGMNYVRDMFVTLKLAPAPGGNTQQLFDGQKLAMAGASFADQFQPGIKDPGFKWNDSLAPLGPAGKRGTHLTVNGQAMSSITTHPTEAWSFIKYLMDPAQNVQIVLANGGRPAARKAVLESPILLEKMKAMQVWAKGIEAAEPWRQPSNYRWPEFNTTITQVFADVWGGKQTVEQALPNATKLLQAVLDKPPVS
jgi:multiple sugar transport system substrate-binding protein